MCFMGLLPATEVKWERVYEAFHPKDEQHPPLAELFIIIGFVVIFVAQQYLASSEPSAIVPCGSSVSFQKASHISNGKAWLNRLKCTKLKQAFKAKLHLL